MNTLPWNLSLLFIRVIGVIRGSHSFRVTNVTIGA